MDQRDEDELVMYDKLSYNYARDAFLIDICFLLLNLFYFRILDHNNITSISKGWLYGLARLEVL